MFEILEHLSYLLFLAEGDDLQEEYHQALATNIVQELQYQKRQKTASQKPKSSVSKDNRKASASKKVFDYGVIS